MGVVCRHQKKTGAIILITVSIVTHGIMESVYGYWTQFIRNETKVASSLLIITWVLC